MNFNTVSECVLLSFNHKMLAFAASRNHFITHKTFTRPECSSAWKKVALIKCESYQQPTSKKKNTAQFIATAKRNCRNCAPMCASSGALIYDHHHHHHHVILTHSSKRDSVVCFCCFFAEMTIFFLRFYFSSLFPIYTLVCAQKYADVEIIIGILIIFIVIKYVWVCLKNNIRRGVALL